MKDRASKLSDRFEPVRFETWKEAVQRGGTPLARLRSETLEGLEVEPLYTEARPVPGLPGLPPYLRGGRAVGPWQIAQPCDAPDPTVAGEALRADLAGGGQIGWLVFGRAVRLGIAGDDPEAAESIDGEGIVLAGASQLANLLEGVDLAAVPLTLEAGANALPLAGLLVAVARQRGLAPDALQGCLGCDPLAALARDGRLPAALDRCRAQLVDLAGWTAEHAPDLRAALVSTRPYHDAGAHAAQELAFAMATGVDYLRWLTEGGLDLEQACGQLRFSLGVGRDLFVELAKLRAARLLWSRVVEACGGSGTAQRMVLHARTAWRTQAARDPWVNMLRGTVEGFVAGVGGADEVSVAPFDEALGPADDFARRIARNTQVLLLEESSLGRVADPAGGSYYVEALTRALAERAWAVFQAIEGGGGMARQLLDGTIGRQVAQTTAARRRALVTRRDPVVGVSQYPHLTEQRPGRPPLDRAALRDLLRASGGQVQVPAPGAPGGWTAWAVDAASRGSTIAEITRALAGDEVAATVTRLARWRDAEPFEVLRDAADEAQRRDGRRPALLLVKLGAAREHKARADFAQGLIESGGIAAVDLGAFDGAEQAAAAMAAADVDGAVICASDARYPEIVPALAPRLRQQGARVVLLAGRPGEHERSFRQAGVELFIHLGVDAVAALEALHQRLEVSR